MSRRPRLGFLGVGWIGRQRLEVLADSGLAEVAMIADALPEVAGRAVQAAPDARLAESLEAMLAADLDGVVIATPSAAHAPQTRLALERGLAVFCQKPLARTAAEAARVVAAARQADRLLDVDFSYRHVAGVPQLRELVQAGALGEIFAVDLTFHNAYGPDKPWFYDIALAGGGCVMDLGIHLLDLALWVLDFPAVAGIDGRLYAQGRPLPRPADRVEDYAVAQLVLETGASVRMACSWRLAAGCDAVIEAAFYGTGGGAALRNVNGSFYDFTVERFHGTRRECLAAPPDAWGGRALLGWTRRLAAGGGFDPAAERLVAVAQIMDTLYGR
ncbi:MAG: Gfo/Idh/MocA family oxidoreductase [Pseudomonadota bacterium]|nr:Gfo/Idh/MocA family oxidoreductase [Pseudomonadota bacterium]